jgi:hypothetical protein
MALKFACKAYNASGHLLATGHLLARGFPDAKGGSTHLILVHSATSTVLSFPNANYNYYYMILAIAIYPDILGVEFFTLRYLRVLRVGILATNDAGLF